MTSLHSCATFLNQDTKHSSLATTALCIMVQSPLVTDLVPLPIHVPVGQGLERGTMDLWVAGSIPGHAMQILNG